MSSQISIVRSLSQSVLIAAVFALTMPVAQAATANDHVSYAPPPAWIAASPKPTDTATPDSAPVRIVYADTQQRVMPTGMETYNAYRVRLLKPEALPLGNISLAWNPAQGDVVVHRVQIIRDGQIIDVLKTKRFEVIQRESGLEAATLTGDLTALLQVPGLQVGDELEVATTVRECDPTLSDHAFGMFQFPVQGAQGAFRYRLRWPEGRAVTLRSSRDLAAAVPAHEGTEQVATFELRDPAGSILNEGAPVRFNVRRLIEYSDFAGWPDISGRFWLPFNDAAKLAPDSSLRARIKQIAAASQDPAERTLAALKLVQDDVRYVYIGLDGGNYRPAKVDETWSRRFGDCKAKTVLLLSVLRELGVEAEPVLVRLQGDDGMDERLPSVTVFNHVLVRAKVQGKSFWLDGTRSGDRYLDMLPQPSFEWALPIRQTGATLEHVTSLPYAHPNYIAALDMDASSGFDKLAKIAIQYVIRGDEGYATRSSLAALSAADADRALRGYWRQQESWVEADTVSWRYDERRASLVLGLVGTGRPEWKGDDKDGHSLVIWHAWFPPPETLRRTKEQDKTAPWLVNFPSFRCWATTIRLPQPVAQKMWSLDADDMKEQIGGVVYWRKAGLQNGILRTVKSISATVREITAEQAQAQTDAIPTFNNNMSQVFETPTKHSSVDAKRPLPFAEGVDWLADDGACIASDKK